MKKYGQADLMCFLVHVYLTEHTSLADDKEKKGVEDRCCSEIMKKYPSAMDMEVGK